MPLDDRRADILQACHSQDVDVLRRFAATEGGLVDDTVRREAWPILLGCTVSDLEKTVDLIELPRHRNENQVQLDVDRSFVYYPEAESDSKRDVRQQELSTVITTTLRRHPLLHYFQGFHDVVQVLLLVLGVKAAIPAAERLSLLRIRDFMLPTMSGTEPHIRLLPTILAAADAKLAQHLSQTQPFFALPVILTLYAHEIEDFRLIARLFDFILASEAVVPVYLFAAMVLSRKHELLEIEADEPDMLHYTLSKLPKPLDLETLISQALSLFRDHPPESLPGHAWSRISKSSVLKTTRSYNDLAQQTLQDGERFLEQEATELRLEEAHRARKRRLQVLGRKYRSHIRYGGIAVLVALVAVLVRRPSLHLLSPSWSNTLLGLERRAFDIWREVAM